MRKLLLTAPLLALFLVGCQNKTPVGPGIVKITESTTSTTTSTTTTSTIPNPTVASFVFSPVTPEELQVVNFDASGSTPGSGRRIVAYNWDFGDGQKKTGITTTHDFTPAGVYLVTLTVTDDLGDDAKSSQIINVRPIPPPPAP
jgi:large repetitive protein